MKCHALLIGINTYHPLAPLSYARNDARAFKAALETECGFAPADITLMQCGVEGGLRAEQSHIENQLNALKLMKNMDLLIFGFWGHGFSQDGNHRYLCSISTTNTDLARTAIPLGIVNETLRQVGARNTVMILDCCQNRSIGRDSAMPELEVGAQAQYAATARDIQSHRANRNKGTATTAVLSACGEGQRAFEWPAREQGIFTAHMLDALKMGKTRLSELVDYVQEKTPLTARQEVQNAQEPFLEMKGGGDINLARHATPPPIAKTVPTNKIWWVSREGAADGPYTEDEISSMIVAGEITQESPLWHKGLGGWKAITGFAQWKGAAAPPPPPDKPSSFLSTLSPLLRETIAEARARRNEEHNKHAKACENGEARGFYNLAEIYSNSQGFRLKKAEREAKSVALFTKAYEMGDMDSCNKLGVMYDLHRGVIGTKKQREAKAIEFFSEASERGDANGFTNLGRMYEKNRGVSGTQNQRDAKAVEFYTKACEMGSATAYYNLGWMYQKGRGVSGTKTEREAKAVKYYTKACKMGSAAACNNLGCMYVEGRGAYRTTTERDTKAVEIFTIACNTGNAAACSNLGLMYEKGRGIRGIKVERHAKAEELYTKACELGLATASDRLKTLHIQYPFVYQDP